MSATLPSEFDRPDSRDVSAGEEIVAPDWDKMVQGTHYLWANDISHIGGVDFDPAFETNSTDITTHGDPRSGSMRPLSSIQMWWRLRKFKNDNNANNNETTVACQAVLQNMTLRFKIYGGVSSTSAYDLDMTASGFERKTVTQIVDTSVLLSNFARIEIHAKAEAEDNALFQLGAWRATVTSASDLPESP